MKEIRLYRGKRSYNGEQVYGYLVRDNQMNPHIVQSGHFYMDGHHLMRDDPTDKPMFFDENTIGQATGGI